MSFRSQRATGSEGSGSKQVSPSGGLHELVRNHLGSLGDLWDAEETRNYAKAEWLGNEFTEDFRLLADIGWGEREDRESFELTTPAHDLMELAKRLHDEAEQVLVGKAPSCNERRSGNPHPFQDERMPGMKLPEIVLGGGEARLLSGPGGREITRWRLNFDLTKPFLKWAGGKQWLSPLARYLVPEDFSVYCEPFLGAGSLFFALGPPRAHLSDVNPELIKAYGGVRADVEDVIARLDRVPYDIETFKKMRVSRPRLDATAAVRFIYLNRTAFNGIYRVNRNGDFNVPFGKYKNPTICQPDRLKPAARTLQSATLRSHDFETAVHNADASWFVYFDPPYITGHLNNGFVKWNARIFNWDDQARLAQIATELQARGTRVLISNADHPAVSGLYKSFHHLRIRRHSLVGGKAASRKDVSELLISSFPIIDRLPGIRSAGAV